MKLDPQVFMAVCAGVTLLILWTSTVIGAAIWLMRKLEGLKMEILADFSLKHAENERTVKALEVLVIRHDTMLDPEFNGGGHSAWARHR